MTKPRTMISLLRLDDDVLSAMIWEGIMISDTTYPAKYEVQPYHNILHGSVFECGSLLGFIGGTSDSATLAESKFESSPTEFTLEEWNSPEDNKYEWQLKRKIHWGGVKWLNACHTTDGSDSCCAGEATFTCESKDIEEIENGDIIKIGETEKFPTLELRRIIAEIMADTYCPEKYL